MGIRIETESTLKIDGNWNNFSVKCEYTDTNHNPDGFLVLVKDDTGDQLRFHISELEEVMKFAYSERDEQLATGQ